ncbi:MAG: hypothetical protein WBA22_14945 [Candidatus Methanofastidiosia archaeon]
MARMIMRLDLVSHPAEGSWNCRVISSDDAVPLGELMLAAYRGNCGLSRRNKRRCNCRSASHYGGKIWSILEGLFFSY